MQLIDEDNVLRIVDQFAHDLFQTLFELTTIFGAGNDQNNVERKNSFVFEERRNFTAHDALGQTFDDGSLAAARFAVEFRTLLSAAFTASNHALACMFAADYRVRPLLLSV